MMPYSVSEINEFTIWEGLDQMDDIEAEFLIGLKIDEIRERGNQKRHPNLGYWLDNCGDDKWYCDNCLQRRECGKRIAYGW